MCGHKTSAFCLFTLRICQETGLDPAGGRTQEEIAQGSSRSGQDRRNRSGRIRRGGQRRSDVEVARGGRTPPASRGHRDAVSSAQVAAGLPTRTRGRSASPSPRPACLLPASSLSPPSPARPRSHPPPPPRAGLWSRPWPSGRGGPGQPRVSEPSLPGQDSPDEGHTAPAPDAARELAPPRGGASAAPPLAEATPPPRAPDEAPPQPRSTNADCRKRKAAQPISFYFRCVVFSRFQRPEAGVGFSCSRERRERAQGLKDGGRRGPGECLLKR